MIDRKTCLKCGEDIRHIAMTDTGDEHFYFCVKCNRLWILSRTGKVNLHTLKWRRFSVHGVPGDQ